LTLSEKIKEKESGTWTINEMTSKMAKRITKAIRPGLDCRVAAPIPSQPDPSIQQEEWSSESEQKRQGRQKSRQKKKPWQASATAITSIINRMQPMMPRIKSTTTQMQYLVV